MMFPDSGLVVGPSHSDGGVYASVANGPDVELEGGEFIINKEATEDFLPLIKQINDIGRMEQMNNADNAQNAHSAIDALIASASTKMMPGGGMVAPKTPMYQEGGAVADRTRVAQTFIPTESLNLPLANLANPRQAGSVSRAPMTNEEIMQMVMDITTPTGMMGSVKRTSKALKGFKDTSGRFAKDPLANRSKKELIRMIKKPVQDDVSVFDTLDDFAQKDLKFLNTNELSEILRESFPRGNINDYFSAGKKYEEGGPLHSRRMFNQGTGFDKKKSDLNKDGKISEYEKKRGMAIAKSMKNQMQMGGMIGMQQPMMQRPMNPAINLSPMQRMGNNMPPMMYQEGGKVSQEDVLRMVDSLYSDVENPFTRELLFQTDPDMKDMPGRVNPMRALLEALTTQRATRDGGRFKSMMGRYKLDDSPKPRGIDELLSNINLQSMMQEARPSREGRDQSQIVLDNLARRIGSSSDIQTPNDLVRYLTTVRPAFEVSSPKDNENIENLFKMLESIDAVPKSRKSMQMGGQVQLRKQAEMKRSKTPELNILFPDLTPSFPPDISGFNEPNISETPMRLLIDTGKVKKEVGDINRSKGFKNAINYNALLEELDKYFPKNLSKAQEGGIVSNNNLMGAMANDRRGAALQPDVYSSKMENGMTVKQRMMVPKLAEAVLPVYGVETPLSRRQSSMLKKNAVSPSALNPNLKGLVNRLLVQRLANETT